MTGQKHRVGIGKLVVTPINHRASFLERLLSSQEWMIDEDCYIEIYGQMWLIEAGETTDFASIPHALQILFPDALIHGAWSVWHDHCYRKQDTSRWLADAGAMELLEHEGWAWPYRAVILANLRLFGWLAWSQNKKKLRRR